MGDIGTIRPNAPIIKHTRSHNNQLFVERNYQLGAGRDKCLTFNFCCGVGNEKLQIANDRAERGKRYTTIQQPTP
jgi:hypothetical protein